MSSGSTRRSQVTRHAPKGPNPAAPAWASRSPRTPSPKWSRQSSPAGEVTPKGPKANRGYNVPQPNQRHMGRNPRTRRKGPQRHRVVKAKAAKPVPTATNRMVALVLKAAKPGRAVKGRPALNQAEKGAKARS